jgi:hypothetical protein
MGRIGHGYGSQWHMLRFLGYHRSYLNQHILKLMPGERIEWIDFTFSKLNDRYYRDEEPWGLTFIADPLVQAQWQAFWPQRGNSHNWDAVAKIYTGTHYEWLFVEAKGHISEIISSCAAKGKGRETIVSALRRTQATFGVSDISVDQWLTPYYQYCNRLAIMHLLQHECQPTIPVRLLFLYFYGDCTPNALCPQSAHQWHDVLATMHQTVGVSASTALAANVYELFLSVNPRVLQ